MELAGLIAHVHLAESLEKVLVNGGEKLQYQILLVPV